MRYIYKSTNNASGKSYVGQTNDVDRRQEEHIADAMHGSDCHFHRAIRKYGKESFTWTLIEECEDHLSNEREAFWIDHFGTFVDGYNMTTGGDSSFERTVISVDTRRKMSESHMGERNHNFGVPKSEETKRKMSEAQKGRKLTEEQRRKNREARLGRKHSSETRVKMSEARRGHIVTEETKRKISEGNKGKKMSQASCEKMSAVKKGKTPPLAVREAVSRALKGRPRSDETKRKISEGHRRRRESPVAPEVVAGEG